MSLKRRTVIIVWCFTILVVCGEDLKNITGEEEWPCRPDTVNFNQCKVSESCVPVDNVFVCRCRKDYVRKDDGVCHPVPRPPPPTPAPQESTTSDGGFGFNLLLWLLLPVVLTGAVAAVFYTGRHKLWFNGLYRMRVRSYNNVLVSSQDEDDPPIA